MSSKQCVIVLVWVLACCTACALFSLNERAFVFWLKATALQAACLAPVAYFFWKNSRDEAKKKGGQ